ncbi:MAG: tetratricopeptide repeat protein [Planctomycetes bacterium]|nr:tetratricopeptide repeat protein [Planctomycetota bacterium]
MIARVAWLAWAAVLCASGAAQEVGGTFRVTRDGERVTVAANRPAVPCDRALGELATALGWRLRWQLDDLGPRLADHLVDLAFGGLDPRSAAQLIAVAGGADVVFHERPLDAGGTAVELVVIEVPDAASAAGRQRLRHTALQWYRRYLDSAESASDPDSTAAIDARMQVAAILRQEGSLEDATRVLEEVYALAPHVDKAPRSLLRLAECYFELGRSATDGDAWFLECERTLQRLFRQHVGSPETVRGTVLLGRLLIEQGRFEECARELERRALYLAQNQEIVDVYLLRATAWFRLDRADECEAALATLDGAFRVASLAREQQADHELLAGFVASQLHPERPDDAERHLRRFFDLSAPDDPRRAVALVMIGQAYLEQQRFLQARAAAVAARRERDGLDRCWARRSSELWAASLLAVGDEDRALLELELDVRKDPDGEAELGVYLAQLFMARGRYRKAVGVLEKIAERGDELGDRARLLQIEALHAQCRETGMLEAFPAQALPIARRMTSRELEPRIAEIFGSVYDALGDAERAADAWRGVLR